MIKELTKLGVSTSRTPEQLLALKKSKIKYIEIGIEEREVKEGLDISEVDSMKSFLKDSSIKLNSVHAPFVNPSGRILDLSSLDEEERTDSLKGVEKAIDLLVRLEGEILVVHPSTWKPIADKVRPARLEQCKRSLKAIVEICKIKKIKVAVENLNARGTSLGNSSLELLSLLEGLDPEIAGVCLDTNHMNLKENLAEAVYRIGERLFTLHVSDNDGREEKHWFPFEGVIKWKPFLEALINCQYDGVFIYEVIYPSLNVWEVLLKVERNFAKMQTL